MVLPNEKVGGTSATYEKVSLEPWLYTRGSQTFLGHDPQNKHIWTGDPHPDKHLEL